MTRNGWTHRRSVEKIIALGNYPAKVTATLDRAEVLTGADVVLTTILAGATDVWRHDIEIPMKYGVDTNVGDTTAASRVSSASCGRSTR